MTKTEGLSLSDLDAAGAGERGHEFEYIRPDGTSSGVFLTVLGGQSATVKAKIAALLNERRRQEIAAAAEAKSSGRTGEAFVPVETDIAFGQKLAEARLTGWRGIKEEFTPELGMKLCQTNQDVASQVIAQSDKVGNFLQA